MTAVKKNLITFQHKNKANRNRCEINYDLNFLIIIFNRFNYFQKQYLKKNTFELYEKKKETKEII